MEVQQVFAADTTTDIGTLDKETAERTHQKAPYSPYAGRGFPTRPFFGDTHTHTSFSMDAGAFGARLGPRDAYRFAKGEEVMASSGQRAKLSRPLDFMVVADHSDTMGFIVKGWLDAQGAVHEKIYDVAWSGDRKPGADGKLPAVGNTVDVVNATWTNTIGAPELIAVWKDPDFNPAQRAFYYGRVIEIPTPRWTAYDAKYYGVKMPPEVPMTTAERAYTSPIWYTPSQP
jgi:hypothetical protein